MTSKKHFLIYPFLLILLISIFSNSLTASGFNWIPGEELVYKVKWSIFRLGTLRLQICDSLQMDQRKVYHTKLFIDSNPVLFFVRMHSVYESYIDQEYIPHLFVADEKIEGVAYRTEYRFNYPDSVISVRMTDIKDTTHIIQKELSLNENLHDGMSMIFFARGNIFQPQEKVLTAFFSAQKGKVRLRIKSPDKKIKIAAFKNELPTIKVEGEAFLTTIAGFTGKYEGWFSSDAQAPPLQAKLKVFIGNVTVELESWKAWTPPGE